MYAVVVNSCVKPDFAEEFRELVTVQAESSIAKEPRRHRFDVAIDPSGPSKWLLYELYNDRAALDTHLATAHFEDLLRRLRRASCRRK